LCGLSSRFYGNQLFHISANYTPTLDRKYITIVNKQNYGKNMTSESLSAMQTARERTHTEASTNMYTRKQQIIYVKYMTN